MHEELNYVCPLPIWMLLNRADPRKTQTAATLHSQGQLALEYLGLKMVLPQSIQGWWVSTSTPRSSEVLQYYTTTVLQSVFTK